MKSILLFLLLLLFSIPCLPQSNDQEKCPSTIESVEKRKQVDPDYTRLIEIFESKIRDRSNLRNPDCSEGKIIVPVAFHFKEGVVSPAQEGCMINLVNEQLNLLNAEISGQDPQTTAYTALQSCYGTDIGNACIEFCLATLDHPVGYGLVEGSPAITFGKIDFSIINPVTVYVPKDPNWAGYLNIFIGDLGTSGASGESPLFGNFDGDGVIIRPCNFGGPGSICPGVNTSGSCGGIYNEGNTVVHEVGHFFGLQHVWGSNPPGCGSDDGILDTPPMGASYLNYQSCTMNNCQDLPFTCNSVDMYMNYMSYASDGCMYMFTSGQADVMYNWATTKGWTTSTPAKCAPPITPVTDFSFSDTDICPSGCVNFQDNSLNNPTSWMWNFSVSSGDILLDKMTSSFADPFVCITGGTSGTISASLTTSNSAGSDGPVVKDVLINVLNESDPRCTPCTQYSVGPYNNFNRANSCLTGCEPTTAGFDVFENESYLLTGLLAGVEYTWDFCNGYSENNWEAVITVASFNGSVGSVVAVVSGCSVTFTPPGYGDYVVIVSSTDGCGGSTGNVGNGKPSFICNPTTCPGICGSIFTDNGGPNKNHLNNRNDEYVICPDGTDAVRVQFNFISLSATGADHIEVYNGMNSNGPKLYDLFGNDVNALPNGGIYESQAPGECLTFKFLSNSTGNLAGWIADVICCDYSSIRQGLFNAQECDDTPVNAGENFSFSFNNNCTPDGTITDISSVRNIEEGFRTDCNDGPTYNKQMFYLFEGKNSTGMMQDMVINYSTEDPSIRNVQLALYGPANLDCPGTIEPGTLIGCDQQSNDGSSNRLSANASISTTQPADGSNFLLVIGTDGSGAFSIEGNIMLSSLPVDLVSFKATPNNGSIQLNWTTASETNNQGFEILKSISNRDEFINIGFVEGQGDSRLVHSYDFVDRDVIPGVTYYYRLKQHDFDGNFSLSPVVQAELNHENRAVIYPNPVREGYFNVILDDQPSKKSRIEIFSIDGKMIKSQTFNTTRSHQVSLDRKGIYLARIVTGGEVLLVEKLIVL